MTAQFACPHCQHILTVSSDGTLAAARPRTRQALSRQRMQENDPTPLTTDDIARPVTEFLASCCRLSPTSYVTSSGLYKTFLAWRRYRQNQGIEYAEGVCSPDTFGRAIIKAAEGALLGGQRIQGQRVIIGLNMAFQQPAPFERFEWEGRLIEAADLADVNGTLNDEQIEWPGVRGFLRAFQEGE